MMPIANVPSQPWSAITKYNYEQLCQNRKQQMYIIK